MLAIPRTQRLRSIRGFTFLELVVVVCLIALLFAFSARQYQKHIDDSKKELVYFQSQAFKRSIENVHALASLQHRGFVDLGQGVRIFMHKSGWPYAASVDGGRPALSISADACRSLWQALFTSVVSENDNSRTKAKYDFDIHVIDNYICRYKKFAEKEESYFFDYDVRTGAVVGADKIM